MQEALTQEQIFVTVDIMALTVQDGQLKLLLSRRVRPPDQGRWALFGKLIGVEETAETAAKALLEEMLPVREVFLEQLYTFSDRERDPRGRVISIAYLAVLPWKELQGVLSAGDPKLRLFTLHADGGGLRLGSPDGTELTGEDLAFDHGTIVETGLLRLRGKLHYTDIAFHFLNDTRSFFLSELQGVFEAVLDKPVDGSNFRRAMLGRYVDTGRMVQVEHPSTARRRGRGRPAALYCLTQD